MKQYVAAFFLALIIVTLCARSVDAAQPPGLYMTPTRAHATLKAGQSLDREVMLKNTSDKSLHVQLSTQQFSVDSKTYNYILHRPLESDWVHALPQSLRIPPGASQTVRYRVTPPSATPGGGYYFLLSATTETFSDGKQPTAVSVAAPLYITVQGEALRMDVQVEGLDIPLVAFGSHFSYAYAVKNNGNIHLEGVSSVQVGSGAATQSGPSLLFMPGTSRRISGDAKSPFWPGVYTVRYGIVSQDGSVLEKTHSIVILPLWSIVTAIFILLLGLRLGRVFQRRAKGSFL